MYLLTGKWTFTGKLTYSPFRTLPSLLNNAMASVLNLVLNFVFLLFKEKTRALLPVMFIHEALRVQWLFKEN